MAPPGTPDAHRRSASMSASPKANRQDEIPSIFSGNQRAPSSASHSKPYFNPSDIRRPTYQATDFSRPRSSSIASRPIDREGPLSPDAADRVFPIRSFMSVEPTPVPGQASTDRGDGYFPSVAMARSRTVSSNQVPSVSQSKARQTASDSKDSEASEADGSGREDVPLDKSERKSSIGSVGKHRNVRDTGRGYQIQGDNFSAKSESLSSFVGPYSEQPGGRSDALSVKSGRANDDAGGLLTARFKHVITEGGHAVITGRDGQTLQRCEDEPIHIPGAVQAFGALAAVQEESDGKLVVRVASENSERILGHTPKQLFALESFTDILSDEQAENLLDHIDFIKDEPASVDSNGPEVFTISVRSQRRRSQKLWCAIHVNNSHPNLIICEFELEDDPVCPLVPSDDRTPELPEDTLSSEPTDEELRDSTENRSRPLRVLRSARKRKGEAAAMEVFNIMSQVQEQLAEAPNLDEFLKILVGVIKELTGFHRVMIYQFDQAWNGRVVTELVDPRATKDLYKGLHFPASDIPKQARDLYKLNKVRLLYDRDQETARLVCKTVEDLENPLDLTHSYLRAMSPIHIKYLANMAVRSSMSISINAFNELWGLISCHTYGTKGTRVSFPIRKMCRLVGDSACRNIERLSYASRLQARKLINTAPTRQNPSGYIIASSDDLLKLFDADFGLLSIRDETKILGKLEATQEALAMLEYLRVRKYTSVLTSLDVRADFPDLRYPPGFQTVAGLLLVPLSSGGSDFIVFFRKGQLREVKWAGNPYEKYVKEGTEGYLEPRKSFRTWSETIVGRCREWTEEEVETASVLCLVYGKFIDVWRQKEAAMQNSQLTKLLLANSAHEVRTPLNAIINYLEIAMEGSLDQETRDNLSRSHSASKSLIYVINDLLDLTKTEAGVELVSEEAFNLGLTYREAADMFQGDAKRKTIAYEVIERPGLPELVLGDQRKIRQAISNVVANAIQATTMGSVRLEMSMVERTHETVCIELVTEDTGVGMNPQQLDALFAELEQAQAETENMIGETIAPTPKALPEDREEKKPLGLGLAVVARIVRNMNGQLRVKSEQGRGSRFSIQFPFDLPASEIQKAQEIEASTNAQSEVAQPSHDSLEMQKEVMLVQPSPSKGVPEKHPPPALSRHNSGGSMRSGRSLSSLKSNQSFCSAHSNKSDVDRLIEAMQNPTMTEEPSSTDRPNSSKSSRHCMSPDRRRSGSSETPSKVRKEGHLRSTGPPRPGEQSIKGTGQPIRPVRMPDDSQPSEEASARPLRLSSPTADIRQQPLQSLQKSQDSHMNVLVAEDDPINSKIVQKRLQKLGHDVYLTVNGEECSTAYGEKPGVFDVVLMDMQVSPLMVQRSEFENDVFILPRCQS